MGVYREPPINAVGTWTVKRWKAQMPVPNDVIAQGENAVEEWLKNNASLTLERRIKNLIVTAGKVFFAKRIGNIDAVAALGWIAAGTSSAPTALGQTALQGTELARVASTNTNPSGAICRLTGLFNAGVGTGTIEEAASFNAAVAGTMANRVLTGTVDKDVDDIVTLTLEIEFT